MDDKSKKAVYVLVGACVLTLVICVVVWWQRGGSDPQPLPEPVVEQPADENTP